MKKANLFIVGAPKCGTTAWRQYLSQHPAIAFCDPKEPHFFSEDFPNFRWCHDLGSYQALFEDLQSYDYRGDASVMYLYSQKAAENIARYNPDAKILILLRDYAPFLQSYHRQQVYNGDQSLLAFEDGWRASVSQNGESGLSAREPSFLDYCAVGQFSNQIQRFLQYFSPDQVRILQYEEWVKAPEDYYNALLDYLSLEHIQGVSFVPHNTAKAHRFKWLAKLTQQPPKLVLSLSRIVRQALGRPRLGVAHWLRQKNRVSLQQEQVVPCKEEISSFFSQDKQQLESFEDLRIRVCK